MKKLIAGIVALVIAYFAYNAQRGYMRAILQCTFPTTKATIAYEVKRDFGWVGRTAFDYRVKECN